jgi:hypothetical protein
MALAWGRSALGAALISLCGCSVILDFGGDLTDGGPGDDAADGDGGSLCDFGEPNDNQASATPIEAGTFMAEVCPDGDRDWYSFSVNGAQDMTVQITFDNMMGEGDLDMLLFSETGVELDPKGNGFGDVEQIVRTETGMPCINMGLCRLPAGNYAVQVFAFDGRRQNAYTLQLTIDPPGGGPDAGVVDGGAPDA